MSQHHCPLMIIPNSHVTKCAIENKEIRGATHHHGARHGHRRVPSRVGHRVRDGECAGSLHVHRAHARRHNARLDRRCRVLRHTSHATSLPHCNPKASLTQRQTTRHNDARTCGSVAVAPRSVYVDAAVASITMRAAPFSVSTGLNGFCGMQGRVRNMLREDSSLTCAQWAKIHSQHCHNAPSRRRGE